MLGALGSGSEAIEFKCGVNAEHLPQAMRHRKELYVDIGPCKPQGLAPELVELTVPAALRTLVPEHRSEVPQALRSVIG